MAQNFAIGTFRSAGSPAFPALVQETRAFALGALHDKFKAARGRSVLSSADSVAVLLWDWDRNFSGLQELAEFATSNGDDAVTVDSLKPAALLRPGTIFCAAANYKAHVAEMRNSGFTGGKAEAESAPLRAYHFLKATSCSSGANDPIVLPAADARIDWEVELAAVIGRNTKLAKAGNALDAVAGYAVCNDVSCRAATYRGDRPNIRTDWLSGKSYDSFFPIGPYLVPRAFVPDYTKLRLELSVNGEIKQNGNPGEMIFNLEQQIEYLSAMLTLAPGDVIATGSPAGVGQGQGQFLKPGDVVEAGITGLGKQRNVVVAPAS